MGQWIRMAEIENERAVDQFGERIVHIAEKDYGALLEAVQE